MKNNRRVGISRGITRVVILTPRWAIKLPRLRWGLWSFSQGVLANLSERDWSEHPGVNPQLKCLLSGMVAIYRRAERLGIEEPDGNDPWWDQISPGLVGRDRKLSNLGVLDGQTVWIDYASPWNGCPNHGGCMCE